MLLQRLPQNKHHQPTGILWGFQHPDIQITTKMNIEFIITNKNGLQVMPSFLHYNSAAGVQTLDAWMVHILNILIYNLGVKDITNHLEEQELMYKECSQFLINIIPGKSRLEIKTKQVFFPSYLPSFQQDNEEQEVLYKNKQQVTQHINRLILNKFFLRFQL